jgi:hypothetical protein
MRPLPFSPAWRVAGQLYLLFYFTFNLYVHTYYLYQNRKDLINPLICDISLYFRHHFAVVLRPTFDCAVECRLVAHYWPNYENENR